MYTLSSIVGPIRAIDKTHRQLFLPQLRCLETPGVGAEGGCVPVCTELLHCHNLLLSSGGTGQHSGQLVIGRK